MNEEKQRKLFLIGMSVLLILVLLFGGTYAWLTLQLKGTKVNVLRAGNLALILDDENSIGIHQDKAVPTLDKVGETLDPYHFTLENLSDLPTGYTIYLDDLDLEEGEERMLDEYLRYSLTKDGTSRTDDLTSTGENPNRVLDSGTIAGGQTITYDLRIWINISTGNEAMNKVFRSKIRVVAIQKEEKDCYVFNKETKEITDYLCSIGNENGMLESSIVTIPEEIDGVTVERIGERAFSNKKLTSVTIPDTVTTISGYAFLNNEISSLVMPSHLVSVGKAAFNNNKLSDSEAFIYKRNSDGSMDTTTVVSYGGSKKTNVIVPSSVKTIDSEAMAYNNLVSIGMQEGMTSIGENAFLNNSLMNVVIPSTVTMIGTGAFYKSGESNPNLTTIANHTGTSFDFGNITGSGSSASMVTGTATHPNGNVTVTIQNKVYIQYHMNGGSLATNHGSTITTSGSYLLQNGTYVTTIPYGVTQDLANYNNPNAINLTRTGYKIESSKVWNTAPDGSGKSYDQTTAYSASDFCDIRKKDCTITLYANWVKAANENIVAVYQYNASNCITGEESTCVEIGPQETYTAGTIIKYKVNASTQKYFHVISENKEKGTLTMQQRENTVDQVAWYETSVYDKYNTRGPLAAIASLESATSGWTNVNNQTYTMGTTVFKTNAFTGCSGNECTKNTYTWASRTARARMITHQEAVSLGCTSARECPVWMINYLNGSTTNCQSGACGTVNKGTSYNYWTMSANSSQSATKNDYVYVVGNETSHTSAIHVSNQSSTIVKQGARAVVVINKQ